MPWVQGPTAAQAVASTTIAKAFSGNVQQRNLVRVSLVSWTAGGGRTVSSVEDNAGGGSNVYTLAGTVALGDVAAWEYWAYAKATEILTVTVTLNIGDYMLAVNEYTGVRGAPLQVVTNSGNTATPTVTVAATQRVMCGGVVVPEAAVTITSNNQYNNRQKVQSDPNGNIDVVDRLLNANDVINWTMGAAQNFAAVGVLFAEPYMTRGARLDQIDKRRRGLSALVDVRAWWREALA